MPKRTKGKNVYLSPDQLRALAEESGRYHSLILLLGTVGFAMGRSRSTSGVRREFLTSPDRVA